MWKPSDPLSHTAGTVEGGLMYTWTFHCLLWAGLSCASLTRAVPRPTLGLLPSFTVVMKLGLPVGKPLCLGLICQAPNVKHECFAIAQCLSPRGPKGHSPEICFMCSYQMSWLSGWKSREKTMNSHPLEKKFVLEWKKI